MSTGIRITADEARRLKNDPAFKTFMQSARENQMSIFAGSSASEVDVREEAHAIMRALDQIEATLDAAVMAEALLDHKQRK